MSKVPMISIVDDDAWARNGVRELVESLEYKAFAFASAEEFLGSGLITETTCLIADIQMQGMSGLDLQRHLLNQGHHVPIIFITAYPDEVHRDRALGAGAICFLSKPFDEQSLIDCLTLVVGIDHKNNGSDAARVHRTRREH